MKAALGLLSVLAILAAAAPVGAVEDTPTPTPTDTSTETPTSTPTSTETAISTPTETAVVTATATATSVVDTPTPTLTATASPTITGTPPTPTPPPLAHIAFLFTQSETRVQNEWECSFNMAASLEFNGAAKTFRTIAAADPLQLRNLYQVIYVAPGLTSSDYGFLRQMVSSGGVIERFVSQGGVTVINVAGASGDQADVAPDGVGFSAATQHDGESILAATHAYITGAGIGGEPLSVADFSAWQHTDMGTLTSLPGGATPVLANSDGQSWVEYRHGDGRVIVTTLTYCTGAEPNSQQAAARNLLRYSRFFSGSAFTPGPTLPPQPTVTATRTPTSTATVTSTPTVTPTPTLTLTPEPTLTPTLTPTPSATYTPTASPTDTPTGIPTSTPTLTSTVTRTPTEVSTSTPTATATATPVPPCAGDCTGKGRVTVDDILTMVNVALGTPDVTCAAGDVNHDGRITVDEILTAVNNALNGCPVATPTGTPSGG
ncbi:MAG: hypothetical protein ACHQ9S_21630 [Candidatus Binatia bacterium]